MDRKSYTIRMESWAKIIMEANNSGMTKTKWCQLHDIRPRQFHYWQKRIRDYLQEHPEASLPGWRTPDPVCKNADEQQAFYEVSVVPETAPAPVCNTTCTTDSSHPVTPISRPLSSPLSSSTINTCPSTHPPLMLQYNQFQLFIGDGVSESTLSSVIRVIRNA